MTVYSSLRLPLPDGSSLTLERTPVDYQLTVHSAEGLSFAVSLNSDTLVEFSEMVDDLVDSLLAEA